MASEGRLLTAEEVKSRKTGDEKRGQGRDSSRLFPSKRRGCSDG